MTSVQAQAIAAARQFDPERPQPSEPSQAALTGATLAFNKPAAKPRPGPKPRQVWVNSSTATLSRPANAYGNKNGPALSRKSSTSSRTSAGSVAVSTHSTGDKLYTGQTTNVDHGNPLSSVNLRPPASAGRAMSPHSPSNIAANLAAARLSPRPQPKLPDTSQASNEMSSRRFQEPVAIKNLRVRQASISRRASEPNMDGAGGNHGISEGTDTTSIPPTQSVVSMFEQRGGPSRLARPATIKKAAREHKRSVDKSPSHEMGVGPQESATVRRLRARQASISRRWDGNPKDNNVDNDGTPEPTDAGSIAPTSSLVKSFERGALAKPEEKDDSSRSRLEGNTAIDAKFSGGPPVPPSKSMTDPVKPVAAPKPSVLKTNSQAAQLTKSRLQDTERPTTTVAPRTGSSSDSSTYASAPETATKPALPPPRRGRSGKLGNEWSGSPVSSAPINISHSKSPNTPFVRHRQPSTATSISPSPPSSLGPRPPYLQPRNYSQTSIKQISPHMSGSNIANAIVAANLSSRTPSPNAQARESSPPLLPPRLEPRHHHLPFSHRRTRTMSPPKKGLRTTMREDPSSSDSSDTSHPHKRHRHRIVRKHPHKHHEGDRLRWRSTITTSERKRYEGVFASNKGLLSVSSSSSSPKRDKAEEETRTSSDEVHGLIVRDIWSRARLSRDCLREIWDLVAGQGGAIGLGDGAERASLNREEFVVGMWLIDQRLKGRKLPIKVGESVWISVRGVGGLVVPKAKRK